MEEVKGIFSDRLYLQVGGNETIGRAGAPLTGLQMEVSNDDANS